MLEVRNVTILPTCNSCISLWVMQQFCHPEYCNSILYGALMIFVVGSGQECLASTPGRPLGEGRPPGINCLRMHKVFCILSSKFDHKLSHQRRAHTL